MLHGLSKGSGLSAPLFMMDDTVWVVNPKINKITVRYRKIVLVRLVERAFSDDIIKCAIKPAIHNIPAQ